MNSDVLPGRAFRAVDGPFAKFVMQTAYVIPIQQPFDAGSG